MKKNSLHKIKTFVVEYYHILFDSAAVNHLRIERITKLSGGAYELTLKFNSFTELKRYQKKTRCHTTASILLALILVTTSFLMGHYF